MVGLNYLFCMFLSFVILCSSFANSQGSEESIATNFIPPDIRNALVALIKPFSDNKVAEQVEIDEDVPDAEVLQTDLVQVSVACELSPLCPKNTDWVHGFALGSLFPFGLLAAKKVGKLLKPKIWKVGLAIKLVFLKLIILKKLLLVKAKLKLIKGKPFILKSPLIIVPILLAVVAANLGNQIGTSETMLGSSAANEISAAPQPSISESFLGPFAQIPGATEEFELLSSLFLTFLNPAQLFPAFAHGNPLAAILNPISFLGPGSPIGAMFNSASIFSPEAASIIPSMMGHEQEIAAFAQLFRNGLLNFGNLMTPNLRRLQSAPPASDFAGIQQVARYVIADSMLDFVSILQLDDATRRDYNEFVGYAKEKDPELLKTSLRDDLINVVKMPEAVMKIVDLKEDLYQDSLSVTVKEIDEALVKYATSVKNIQM